MKWPPNSKGRRGGDGFALKSRAKRIQTSTPHGRMPVRNYVHKAMLWVQHQTRQHPVHVSHLVTFLLLRQTLAFCAFSHLSQLHSKTCGLLEKRIPVSSKTCTWKPSMSNEYYYYMLPEEFLWCPCADMVRQVRALALCGTSLLEAAASCDTCLWRKHFACSINYFMMLMPREA